jgi:hypothetical protein
MIKSGSKLDLLIEKARFKNIKYSEFIRYFTKLPIVTDGSKKLHKTIQEARSMMSHVVASMGSYYYGLQLSFKQHDVLAHFVDFQLHITEEVTDDLTEQAGKAKKKHPELAAEVCNLLQAYANCIEAFANVREAVKNG